jgi:hypothetical protein
MDFDEIKLKGYLLHNLPDEEMREIELRLLEDADFVPAIADAEAELIEDYIDGTLTAVERELFQKNFLISSRRKEDVKFLRLLKNEIANIEKTEDKTLNSLNDGFSRFFNFSKLQFATAGVAVLISIVFLGWWLASYSIQSGSHREIALLNQKDLSDLSTFDNAPTLSLTYNVFRGNDSARVLTGNSSEEPVLLRLALPSNFSSPIQLKLFRNSKQILALDEVRQYQNQGGAEVRLLFPPQFLEKGELKIELQSENEKVVYNFAVR